MKIFFNAMSKYICVVTLAMLMTFASHNAFALSAVAQQIQGEVSIHKAADAQDAWKAITQDTPLASGDSIKTGKGTCALVYSDQATFKMEENTSLALEETPTAQDLKLFLGKIKGQVNHQNATQPFEVVTPAAVATVRGTQVDFGYDYQGQLTVDLHNGKIQVINDDAELKLDLAGKKSIGVKYNKEKNTLHIKNDCNSDGVIQFSILGAEYAENPCEEKDVELSTAENGLTVPNTNSNNQDDKEKIGEGEGREPISPIR